METYLGHSPALFVLATLAGFGAFVVGSTFGVGGAMLLTATLLLFMPAPEAVAVIVPAMVINSALTFWVHREHLDRKGAWRLAITVLPTAIVAALFTDLIDHELLQALIGLAILSALAVQYGRLACGVTPDRQARYLSTTSPSLVTRRRAIRTSG